MLEVRELRKRYKDQKVIADISFTAQPNDSIALIGPNGAGKSTLIKILATLTTPDSGEVFLEQIDLLKDPRSASIQIGYLGHTAALHPWMSVSEQLDFVAQISNLPANSSKEALDRCGLGEYRLKLCGSLSYGVKKRVGLAQALMKKPRLLLLDEPFAGLDPRQAKRLHEILQAKTDDTVTLISTHHLHEVALFCNRAISVHSGVITFDQAITPGDSITELISASFVREHRSQFTQVTEGER